VSNWSDKRLLLRKRKPTRRQAADDFTHRDLFFVTRERLAEDRLLPDIVQAVAAYPSREAWSLENQAVAQTPPKVDASTALVSIAYPLLVPDLSMRDPLDVLVEAAELARDPDFRTERHEFFEWLNGYLYPFTSEQRPLNSLTTDMGSLDLAQKTLQKMLHAQQRWLRGRTMAHRWERVEYASVIAAALGGVVAAALGAPEVASAVGLAGDPAALGIASAGGGSAIASLVGWKAGRNADVKISRPLNGASMFTSAQKRIGGG
jgi:hypothetical protein